ncbi:MAG: hypothetical protein A2Z72_00495 [Omnitrophica bacterium RBG_13_46_9]|nr:MAG: hypothetical protein A2Z72_00495 [Omnitrophica bacterium RBG_13_46_9]
MQSGTVYGNLFIGIGFRRERMAGEVFYGKIALVNIAIDFSVVNIQHLIAIRELANSAFFE